MRLLPVLLVAAALAGCGDGETVSAPSPTPEATAVVTETPTPTPTPTETATPIATEQPAPEDQEGGAGDEIPASSQALVTGDGGKLSPGTVRVPPFIAIRVQLRSADGVEYELTGGGKTVKAGGEIETDVEAFKAEVEMETGSSVVVLAPGEVHSA